MNVPAATATPKAGGRAQCLQPLAKAERDRERQQRLVQQHVMRIADEGRKSPMRLPEPGSDRAVEDEPPIDPHGVKNRAPDRRSEIALDQIFPAQEIVIGASLPIAGLGLDAPGCGLAVGRGLQADNGRAKLIKPAELAQFGPEHAVVLREAARIVSLHIDDMAVLNGARTVPRLTAGLDISPAGRAKNQSSRRLIPRLFQRPFRSRPGSPQVHFLVCRIGPGAKRPHLGGLQASIIARSASGAGFLANMLNAGEAAGRHD